MERRAGAGQVAAGCANRHVRRPRVGRWCRRRHTRAFATPEKRLAENGAETGAGGASGPEPPLRRGRQRRAAEGGSLRSAIMAVVSGTHQRPRKPNIGAGFTLAAWDTSAGARLASLKRLTVNAARTRMPRCRHDRERLHRAGPRSRSGGCGAEMLRIRAQASSPGPGPSGGEEES